MKQNCFGDLEGLCRYPFRYPDQLDAKPCQIPFTEKHQASYVQNGGAPILVEQVLGLLWQKLYQSKTGIIWPSLELFNQLCNLILRCLTPEVELRIY